MPIQLHISRIPLNSQCVIYRWMYRADLEEFSSNTANSIAECLVSAAVIPPPDTEGQEPIEILYRTVALGSFPMSKLGCCAGEIADLIVERHNQMRMHA